MCYPSVTIENTERRYIFKRRYEIFIAIGNIAGAEMTIPSEILMTITIISVL